MAHAVDEGELIKIEVVDDEEEEEVEDEAKLAPRKGEATKAVFETMAGLHRIGLVDKQRCGSSTNAS